MDIAVGDFQSLGLGLNFGGPYGGFIATKDAYKRHLCGRVAGKTVDASGKTAYTLTMQAREQHIKREKATSNICSNQALCALTATVYMFLMGEKGLKEIAELSRKQAHKLADGLRSKGYEVLSKEFFNEFVLKVPDSAAFLAKMKEHNILAGIKIDENKILVTTTEVNDDKEIEDYIKFC
ncbi:glycine cleavage system protein P (pyridoxal-binding), N-terminal domain [Candidatus Gastranaerophilus sp. (ex Termes propinquus)]|nr:glycine cleavage system protein P (pyridoxal-binding), N-terminal domain [Candidatus Gastranaerophilus sp. (ex Termes propinquus)]